MSLTAPLLDSLYTARAGVVDLVDVPELAFLSVSGQGAPEGPAFADAVQALYSVSYTAHFLLEQQRGTAPRMRPLEALWWTEDPEQQRFVTAMATGAPSSAPRDPGAWRWQAMILQPREVDGRILAQALHPARARRVRSLDAVRPLRWTEGRCAQTLHVGPYAEEGPTIARLHAAIAEAGLRPRGRHHEIYLGDPRRSAPERLRTLLRQPVEPA
ncbi:MAG: GyrI-like domain-containing protein [Amnibacterium sp.]